MVYHYLIAVGAVIGTIYGLKSHSKGVKPSPMSYRDNLRHPREWAKHAMSAVSFSEREGPRPKPLRLTKVDALESFIQTRYQTLIRTSVPAEIRGMDMRNISCASDPPAGTNGVLHEEDVCDDQTRDPGTLSRFRRHLEIKQVVDAMASPHTSRATQWLLYEQFQQRDPWSDVPIYSEPRILAGTWPERDEWEEYIL